MVRRTVTIGMTPPSEELTRIREKLDEIAESQAEMRGHLKSISGNGQPGRLGVLEIRQAKMERQINRMYGYAMALGSLAALAADIALRLWH